MKLTHLLLATFLSLSPLAPVIAQEDTPIANEAEFTLLSYHPQWVNANSLLRTVESLFGRQVTFEDRKVANLTVLGDAIVIYEEAERMGRILKAIEQLDINPNPTPVASLPEKNEVETRSLGMDEMVMENFIPEHIKLSEFHQLAQKLYGRKIRVNDEWHDNLRMMSNNNLMIFEEKGKVAEILKSLVALDASQAMNAESELVVMEYQPRHLSPKGVMEGLTPFRSPIYLTKGNRSYQIQNITMLEERGIILVRDYADAAEEIMTTMKRLDQPAPQVMVSCQILRGVEEISGQPAKQELQDQLLPLLPYKAYQVEAVGMLRASALSGTKMELEMSTEGDIGFSLQLMVGAFDEQTGSLSLDRCHLVESNSKGARQLFSTSTTVYSGEHAVLGVTGASPLFLVVRVNPVKPVH